MKVNYLQLMSDEMPAWVVMDYLQVMRAEAEAAETAELERMRDSKRG